MGRTEDMAVVGAKGCVCVIESQEGREALENELERVTLSLTCERRPAKSVG
jgi:hypothetical protein